MRANADYELVDRERVRALIREHPWVTIVSAPEGGGAPVASHYPVILEPAASASDTDSITLLSHVGRPDEQLHGLGTREVLVIVYGPQGYISPGWYEANPAVPTWNFVAAHLYGTPEILTDAENLEVLDRLVEHFERELPHPHLMRQDAANTAYAERIVRGTVGFRLRVTRLEAKEKMSQDKPEAVIDRVIDALRQPGPYENHALAARMAEVNGRHTP
jgi:transcriptional regulator